jgi:hypothetical protein
MDIFLGWVGQVGMVGWYPILLASHGPIDGWLESRTQILSMFGIAIYPSLLPERSRRSQPHEAVPPVGPSERETMISSSLKRVTMPAL